MPEVEARKVIIDAKVEQQVREFLSRSTYQRQGGILTDLGGTIVHENDNG